MQTPQVTVEIAAWPLAKINFSELTEFGSFCYYIIMQLVGVGILN
jgi:hypothetical protein